MPFNKGDFTQQGVAGHVNANLRLNEKRLVNIDLTSNEEAEGCTIAGAVTDLLNNEVYPIGSGVSGNIEITENGENINVAPFATATVNVAGGGLELLKTQFTVVNENNEAVNVSSTIMLFGYCVNMHDFSDVAPNRLLMNIDEDGNIVIQLSTLLPTVPANTTLTFDLFYVRTLSLDTDYAIAMRESAGSRITNMEYDTDAYIVTDKTDNSAITYTLTK